MKRIIAIICALALSCAVFAGCSDKAEQSRNTNTSDGKETSSVDENAASAESTASAEDTTLARAYTDSLEGKDFKVTMVTSSDYMDDTVTMVETCGGDYHMSIGEDEEKVELYVIGGVMYVLNHADKHYIKNEQPEEKYLKFDAHTYTMGVEDSYIYVDSATTEDGLICETYRAPDMLTGEMTTDADDEKMTVYKYYFNEGGDAPVKIGMSAYGMEQMTSFNDFSFEVSPIELPDLSDWTDESESNESLDENAVQPEADSDADENVEVEQAQAGETD